MGYSVQQNVAGQPLKFLLVNSVTHIPGVTGLDPSTFTVWLSKDGGALALAAGGAITEIGRGRYAYWTQASDVDTTGTLGLSVSAPGADPSDEEFFVTEYDPTVTTPAGAGSFITQMQNRGFGSGLTAAQWSQVYTDALALYSRHRPRTILGTITSVAGQESYALPTSGYMCLAVAPWDGSDLTGDATQSVEDIIQEQIGDAFIYSFHQPSLADIYHGNLEAVSRQWGASWVQDDFGGAIRLIPVPQTADTLAVLYTAPHASATTVPAAENDLLLKAGMACAYGALAVSGAVSVISSGGRLTLGPYTRDMGGVGSIVGVLAKQATEAEKAFLDAARTFAPGVRA
jgi:hypothetical protein